MRLQGIILICQHH